MTSHLKSCKDKKAFLEKNQDALSDSSHRYYHLLVEDSYNKEYWLHILIDGRATLKLLDDILRGIWLECCGHLSGFMIDGERFESDTFDDFDFETLYSLHVRLDKVLWAGVKFDYTYDYGSSTDLNLRVVDSVTYDSRGQGAYLMARNEPISKREDNSPRVGVCGYEEDKGFRIEKYLLSQYEEDGTYLSGDGRKEWEQEDDEDEEVDLGYNDDFDGFDEFEELDTFFQEIANSRAMKKLEAAQRKNYETITPCDLKTALSRMTKDELTKAARFHQIQSISKLSKVKLIEKMVMELPGIIEGNLPYLATQNMDRYVKLLKNHGILTVEDLFKECDPIFMLRDIAACYAIFSGSMRSKDTVDLVCILPEEILAMLQTKNLLEMRTWGKRNELWVKLTLGLLYYYGVKTIDECILEIERVLKVSIERAEYERVLVLFNAADEQLQMIGNYLIHYFAEDYEEILQEQRTRPSISFKKCTKQQLLAAAEESFYPKTQAIERLKGLVSTTFDVDKEEWEFLIEDILDQFDEQVPFNEVFRNFSDEYELENLAMANQFMKAVGDVYNQHRQWFLKGYAPSELVPDNKSIMGGAPFTQQKQGFPQTFVGGGLGDHSAGPVDNVIDLATRRKVGRNDPCPCGSGRKYKHCCGK